MAWVEKDLKDNLVSTLLLWGGLPVSGPGCPEPHPAWDWKCSWMIAASEVEYEAVCLAKLWLQNWLGLLYLYCALLYWNPISWAVMERALVRAMVKTRVSWGCSELYWAFLVAAKHCSSTSKCNGEDKWLRSISLITLWTHTLQRCMSCGMLYFTIRLLHYFESLKLLFTCRIPCQSAGEASIFCFILSILLNECCWTQWVLHFMQRGLNSVWVNQKKKEKRCLVQVKSLFFFSCPHYVKAYKSPVFSKANQVCI